MKPIKLIVLIPAYNEAVVIAKTIQSIVDAGIDVEQIYVINDASTDETSKIAHGLNVNVIDNEKNMGKAHGVQNALSVIDLTDISHVCFMDADTLVDVDYFRIIEEHLANDAHDCLSDLSKKPISVLCGRVKSIPHNWLTAFRAYELWLSQALHKTAQSKIKTITVAPGCASTYSVEALKDVIWSEDTTVEDMDATIQVIHSGGIIQYESKAIVYTQDPSTVKDYLGQIGKRWYPGVWQVLGKHKVLRSGFFKMFNWECRLMILEPIFFVSVIAYVVFFKIEELQYLVESAYGIILTLAMMASALERRLDILKYSFVFPILMMVSLFLFVSKVGNIFGRKKSVKWFSPTRYSMKEPS